MSKCCETEFELSTNNALVTYSRAIRALSKLISLEKININIFLSPLS